MEILFGYSCIRTGQLWLPLLPGGWDEGLCSQEEEQHDEGADQVGVEHLIPHLGELDKEKDPSTPAVSMTLDQLLPLLPNNLRPTFSSMWASLKTRVSVVMCSLCMRSLLCTSMACLMRLLISLEVDCQMLGSEPFVNEAKILIFGRETK